MSKRLCRRKYSMTELAELVADDFSRRQGIPPGTRVRANLRWTVYEQKEGDPIVELNIELRERKP
jgi:hypothetical protein